MFSIQLCKFTYQVHAVQLKNTWLYFNKQIAIDDRVLFTNQRILKLNGISTYPFLQIVHSFYSRIAQIESIKKYNKRDTKSQKKKI